eukprot:3414190-Prymnesium_polylepis.1
MQLRDVLSVGVDNCAAAKQVDISRFGDFIDVRRHDHVFWPGARSEQLGGQAAAQKPLALPRVEVRIALSVAGERLLGGCIGSPPSAVHDAVSEALKPAPVALEHHGAIQAAKRSVRFDEDETVYDAVEHMQASLQQVELATEDKEVVHARQPLGLPRSPCAKRPVAHPRPRPPRVAWRDDRVAEGSAVGVVDCCGQRIDGAG